MQKAGNPLETFLRAYDARDDDAAWEIYKRNHAPAGNRITRALVDDFLAENPKRNPTENLQALNYLGQLEIRKTKDAYTSDLARIYSSASLKQKHFWSRLGSK